jgi:hypothetical protein
MSEMKGDQLALFGDTALDGPRGDRPQNGRVLVCWWWRCQLDLRPRSGHCVDCSQVTAMPVEKVRPHHRVVGDGRER